MNCSHCGGPNERSAKYCIHCGTSLRIREQMPQTSPHYYEKKDVYEASLRQVQETSAPEASVEDKDGCRIAILSFLFPLAGLIMWISWFSNRPKSARIARNAFLASVFILLVLFLLWGSLAFCFVRYFYSR